MAKYISNIWTTTLYLFTNGEDNTVVCFQMDSVQLYTTHCKDIQFAGNSEGCKRYLWLWKFYLSLCLERPYPQKGGYQEHTEKETCAMEGATLWLENFLESHVKPDTRVAKCHQGVLDLRMEEMRESLPQINNLFNNVRLEMAGSVLNDTKVGESDEFDVNVVIKLPFEEKHVRSWLVSTLSSTIMTE